MTGLVVRGRAVGERGIGLRRRRREAGWSTPARIWAGTVAGLVLAMPPGRHNRRHVRPAGRGVPVHRDPAGSRGHRGHRPGLLAQRHGRAGRERAAGRRERALAADRAEDLATYCSDRSTADKDLQQATVTAAGVPPRSAICGTVLDRMGQYEALAADAILTSSPAAPPAVPAIRPRPRWAYYRQATDLMRTGILPTVSSLTSVNSGELDDTYQAGQSGATAPASPRPSAWGSSS